jgi:hypothetical protein
METAWNDWKIWKRIYSSFPLVSHSKRLHSVSLWYGLNQLLIMTSACAHILLNPFRTNQWQELELDKTSVSLWIFSCSRVRLHSEGHLLDIKIFDLISRDMLISSSEITSVALLWTLSEISFLVACVLVLWRLNLVPPDFFEKTSTSWW